MSQVYEYVFLWDVAVWLVGVAVITRWCFRQLVSMRQSVRAWIFRRAVARAQRQQAL